MSDFWKKFKGVFIEEIPASNDNTQSQNNIDTINTSNDVSQNKDNSVAAPQTPSRPNQPIIQVPLGGSSGGQGKVNDKFMEMLFRAMESVNTPTFDYFEYKQALNNLANMPMDEATRYKSAFAMAQTMGATSDNLVKTASGYLDALKQEEAKFLQAASNQVQSQVGNKQAQIDNFDVVIKQKNEQIKKLLDEIEQHKKEMEVLKSDIAQAATKVAQTKSDFETTYQLLVSQIQKDIDNMKNYLK